MLCRIMSNDFACNVVSKIVEWWQRGKIMNIERCILVIVTILVVLLGLTGCSNKELKQEKTAEDIVIELKERGLKVGRYVTYTEESDLNDLLGRPNQYISKTTFEVIGLEQINNSLDSEYFSEEEINEPTGGTVEVFNNKEDMKKRKEYVETISSSMSALSEYSYGKGCVLLRLDHQLTPSEAKEYENIFNEIIKD